MQLINGKPLKSVNQHYNKLKAKYQSYLTGTGRTSNKIESLTYNRNRFVDNYLHQTSRIVADYLIEHNIKTLVIGKNENWKQKVNLGKRNNQTAVAPLGETTGRINCAGDHRRQPLPRRSLRSTRSLYPSDRRPHCLNFTQIPHSRLVQQLT